MKAYLLHMVRGIAEHPRSVSIGELTGAVTSVFEVRCHADDRSQLIGRNGRVISALRALAQAAAQRQQRQVVLELAD